MRRSRVSWACGLAAIAGIAAASPACAQAIRDYDISPQMLEPALVTFAMKEGVALSLPTGDLSKVRTGGVRGAYTRETALAMLLDGTGFTFLPAGPDRYRIIAMTRKPESAAPPPAPADTVIVSARLGETEATLARDVSRIGSDRLTTSAIDEDARLAREIVGLSFTNLGDGRNKILLRGLSDGALTGRTQSLVGLYLDETRITYGAPDPDLQLVDVRSVEVLRGPQGALYGAGAMGGIVRIETNPVDLENYGGSARAAFEMTRGGEDGRRLELVLNAPVLPGALGLRGVLYRTTKGGWLDNPVTGARDANHVERSGFRASARAELDGGWSIEASTLSQGITSRDAQYLEATPLGVVRTAALVEPHDNDFNMTNVTVRGRLGEGDLVSSTSYVRHHFDSRFDATGAFPQFGASGVQPIDEEDALRIIVHETRYAADPDEGRAWFLGLFYADGDNGRIVTVRHGVYGEWAGAAYQERRTDAIDEFAVFGEIMLPLAESLSLNAGLRAFHAGADMASTTSEPLLGLARSQAGSTRSSGLAPDLRLAWRPLSDVVLYGSAAKGFRAGGFNTGGPIGASPGAGLQPFDRFRPDNIWTYEIGGHARTWGGRLELRGALYASTWTDLQTDQLIAEGFPFTGNAGIARLSGLDIDATYRPDDVLEVRLRAQISEPDVRRADPSFPQATGGPLPGSPEYTLGGSLAYRWPLTIGTEDLRASAELNAAYTGPSTLGFGAGAAIGRYATLNARITLGGAAWQASVFGDNLLNSGGDTYSFGNPYLAGRSWQTPERPRTLGVSLSRTF